MSTETRGETLIAASSLALGYRRNKVLSDVSLRVNKGEFWFLLGPNGRGKTTFVRAVLGGISRLGGDLRFGPDMDALRAIGYVPQRAGISRSAPITVREFVDLGTVGLKLNRQRQTENREWALGKVGLAGLADRDYWALSGGQRQRALVARALIRRPSLIILDEPTNGIDLPTEHALLSTLADLRKREGLAVLFVTHDLSMAFQYGTNFAFFHDGTVTTRNGLDAVTPELLEATFGASVHLSKNAEGGTTLSMREDNHD